MAEIFDFDSLMKAAEEESKTMSDVVEAPPAPDPSAILNKIAEHPEIITETIAQNPEVVSSVINNLPNLQSLTPTKDTIKSALSNNNIGNVLNQMAANPDAMTNMMSSGMMNNLSPEMMEQARKMATSGQGDQILKEMQKRGMNPMEMKHQLMEQRKALNKMMPRTDQGTQQIILINKSRQTKIKKIIPGSLNSLVLNSQYKFESPVELSCSRLAIGPLKGKTVKIWYDEKNKCINKRASKIVGFKIGGDILIVVKDHSLTEKEFLAVENQLA